jgi:outer membrane protein TolC
MLEGNVGIQQSIYSESLWSSYSIEQHLQEGRESGLRATELDIALEAANAYLLVLRASAVARIQRANLRVSLSNLELARVREAVGASGRSDVYRWESQVATNRRNVLDADADVEVTRIELNRVLNRPLEEPFVAQEVAVDDPLLITGEPALYPYFANPETFAVYRDFMVAEGWSTSPELRQLDAAIAAQGRAHTAAKRSYWVPDVDLSGGLNYVFERSGAGASGPSLPPPFPADALAPPPDFNWSVELGLSLPIFTGLARRATVKQTSLDLDRLELERESVAAVIAQRVRTALHLGGASFAGIEQARVAAEAARLNLEIVTESYASGAASVITLIDAQNALLVAQQAASNAAYDFLLDLVQVERAIGKFYFLQSAEEQQGYFRRLEEFYRQAGVAPRR